ncbi:MAG: hypothetical protein E7166_01935 [Firmicutes bacterium]|nr:hypothetical protein [Bacillota bacterium]
MKYVDLIVLIGFIVFVIIYSKKFQTYIFGFAVTDIFFRVLDFLKNNIPITGLKGELSKYVPESIPSVIYNYTDGTISYLLMWTYIVIMIIFLYYVTKIFIKRRRIS